MEQVELLVIEPVVVRNLVRMTAIDPKALIVDARKRLRDAGEQGKWLP